jgi:hypothetical protein
VDDSGKVIIRSFRLVFDRGYRRLFKIDRYRCRDPLRFQDGTPRQPASVSGDPFRSPEQATSALTFFCPFAR